MKKVGIGQGNKENILPLLRIQANTDLIKDRSETPRTQNMVKRHDKKTNSEHKSSCFTIQYLSMV